MIYEDLNFWTYPNITLFFWDALYVYQGEETNKQWTLGGARHPGRQLVAEGDWRQGGERKIAPWDHDMVDGQRSVYWTSFKYSAIRGT